MTLTKVITFFFFISLLVSAHTFATNELQKPIPEIGPYVSVLRIEKNFNSENKLVVYTKVTDHCRFLSNDRDLPVLDYFWLMKGLNYKPLNPLLKSEIEKRVIMTVPPLILREKYFYISLSELNDMDHDIPDPRLRVSVEATDSGCNVRAQLKLGPSNANVLVNINSFYGESASLFRPKILLVTIKGHEAQSGKAIFRTYRMKK